MAWPRVDFLNIHAAQRFTYTYAIYEKQRQRIHSSLFPIRKNKSVPRSVNWHRYKCILRDRRIDANPSNQTSTWQNAFVHVKKSHNFYVFICISFSILDVYAIIYFCDFVYKSIIFSLINQLKRKQKQKQASFKNKALRDNQFVYLSEYCSYNLAKITSASNESLFCNIYSNERVLPQNINW